MQMPNLTTTDAHRLPRDHHGLLILERMITSPSRRMPTSFIGFGTDCLSSPHVRCVCFLDKRRSNQRTPRTRSSQHFAVAPVLRGDTMKRKRAWTEVAHSAFLGVVPDTDELFRGCDYYSEWRELLMRDTGLVCPLSYSNECNPIAIPRQVGCQVDCSLLKQ